MTLNHSNSILLLTILYLLWFNEKLKGYLVEYFREDTVEQKLYVNLDKEDVSKIEAQILAPTQNITTVNPETPQTTKPIDSEEQSNKNDLKWQKKHSYINTNSRHQVDYFFADSPAPIFTSDLLVVVISARDHFEHRQVIRNTWGKNESNVFFIVGAYFCQYPPEYRSTEYGCASSSAPNQQVLQNYTLANEEEDRKLKLENDVILMPVVDVYDNLTLKMKLVWRWVDYITHHAAEGSKIPKWVLKIDDDSLARVQSLVGRS